MSILVSLATVLGEVLCQKKWMIVTAESCTGGQVAESITSISGSSLWFDRGFITYSNRSKTEMLDVPVSLLESHGAVSSEVAQAMLEGALHHSQAKLGLAVTGIAGPQGGSRDKPVGTVWIAFGFKEKIQTRCYLFKGDRFQIRFKATETALEVLLQLLEESK